MFADLALNPDPLILAKYRSESTISKGGTELSVNDNVVSCLLKEREKKIIPKNRYSDPDPDPLFSKVDPKKKKKCYNSWCCFE